MAKLKSRYLIYTLHPTLYNLPVIRIPHQSEHLLRMTNPHTIENFFQIQNVHHQKYGYTMNDDDDVWVSIY